MARSTSVLVLLLAASPAYSVEGDAFIRVTSSAEPVKVIVNGAEIGTVQKETKDLRYTPSASGVNTLKVEVLGVSASEQFTSHPRVIHSVGEVVLVESPTRAALRASLQSMADSLAGGGLPIQTPFLGSVPIPLPPPLYTLSYKFRFLGAVPLGEKSTKVKSITLDKDEYTERAADEIIRVLRGTTATSEHSHTIKHSADVKLTTGVEFSTEADLLIVKGSLKAHVEASVGRSFTESETKKKTVTIDGDKLQNVRIIWIDKYRKGTASISIDGKDHVVPFTFPVSTELVLEEIKE